MNEPQDIPAVEITTPEQIERYRAITAIAVGLETLALAIVSGGVTVNIKAETISSTGTAISVK